MLDRLFALTIVAGVAALAPGAGLAQTCLHGQGETAANRERRQQAIRVANGINLAQAQALRFDTQRRGYRPLNELANVPLPPRGFTIQFHTDSETYSVAIKDTLDPCRYAVFSDQDRFIYEAIASRQGMIVPATEDDGRSGAAEPRKRE
jgi:hypothetical protein